MAKIAEPYVHVTERVRETPTLLAIDGTTNIGGVVVSPKGKLYQYIEGPQDFLDKLVGADELPRNSHVSLINAYYCSYFAGLVIARSLNTLATAAVLIDLNTNEVTKVDMLKDTILNSVAYVNVATENLMTTGDTWAFVINNTCFYNASEAEYNNYIAPYLPGAANATAIRVNIDNPNTILSSFLVGINSWAGFNGTQDQDPLYGTTEDIESSNLVLQFNDPYEPRLDASNYVVIDPKFYYRKRTEQFDALINIKSTGIENYIKITRSSDTILPDRYLLIHTMEPSNENGYMINFDTVLGRKGIYTMSILRGENQEIYTVSLDTDGKTEDGQNCFIENLNSTIKDLQFTVHDPEGIVMDFTNNAGLDKRLTTGYFGDSGVILDKCKNAAYMSAACYRLAEQKEFRIEYLSEFGYTEAAYMKDYQYVGAQNYWFSPITFPYSYSNAASMAIFANGMNNDNNVMVAGVFDKNSTFLGWPTKIAFTSLYYERVFINKSNNSEYAPCFEETNGVLNYRNPMFILGETDRVKLLNGTTGPANCVVFNQDKNIYYLNDNRCHTTTHNVMSEEMNRRMVNRIKKDVIQIMNRFKGRTNTVTTREDVVAILDIYMKQNIMTQNYKPEEYQIVCDTTNNTVEVITSNHLAVTLKVRLLGSIKFIDVLTDIFPLGIDFAA